MFKFIFTVWVLAYAVLCLWRKRLVMPVFIGAGLLFIWEGDIQQAVAKAELGYDRSVELEGGHLDVYSDPSDAFELSYSLENRVGRGVNLGFETEIEGQKVGFSVRRILHEARRSTPFPEACEFVPVEHGLLQVVQRSGVLENCSKIRLDDDIYTWADAASPHDAVRCDNGAVVNCGVIYVHGRFLVSISMWKTPPDKWLAAIDRVNGVLDRSFKARDFEKQLSESVFHTAKTWVKKTFPRKASYNECAVGDVGVECPKRWTIF